MTEKILIIEDDQNLQEYMQEFLIEAGYKVEVSSDGITALKKIDHSQPDLILLDLGLPNISGETVCSDIRKQYPQLPIIILTGKDSTADIVHGLNLGADDYITKPFETSVLLARIKARLRQTEEEVLQVETLFLNNKTLEVSRNKKAIILSPQEFKLLQYLLINKGRVVSREMILNRVWQYSYDVDSRVVDVYIGYLRKKIDKEYPIKLIKSVRGFGYMIKE